MDVQSLILAYGRPSPATRLAGCPGHGFG